MCDKHHINVSKLGPNDENHWEPPADHRSMTINVHCFSHGAQNGMETWEHAGMLKKTTAKINNDYVQKKASTRTLYLV